MTNFHTRIAEEKIRIVCCIDDENAPPPIASVEELTTRFMQTDQARLQYLLERRPELSDVIAQILDTHSADASDRIDAVNEALHSLFAERQWESGEAETIARALPSSLVGSTASKLAEIFNVKGVEFKALSFSEWALLGAGIISAADPASRVLLLIDELNEAEPQALLDGKEVLTDLASRHADKAQDIDCIIVTNKCSKESELLESQKVYNEVKAALLSKSPGQRTKKVFVLAKERLQKRSRVVQQELLTHFDRIEAARLGRRLATAAREVLKAAVDDAMHWVEDMPLSEFHGSVFISSELEGTSEADTLLRLVALKQEIALEQVMATKREITDPIEKIRRIPNASVMHSAAPDSLRELRKLEFEREGDHINHLRLPLVCGDVFELVGRDRAATERIVETILLGNPCDLVLRKNGTRNSSFGILAEITRDTSDRDSDGAASELTYLIKTGRDAGSITYKIRLNKISSIPLPLLDLVWTNKAGLAHYLPREIEEAKPHLTLSQQAAVERLLPVETLRSQILMSLASKLMRSLRRTRTREITQSRPSYPFRYAELGG